MATTSARGQPTVPEPSSTRSASANESRTQPHTTPTSNTSANDPHARDADDVPDTADGDDEYTPHFIPPTPENSPSEMPQLSIVSQNLRGMGKHKDERNRKMTAVRTAAEEIARADVIFLQELKRTSTNEPTTDLEYQFRQYNVFVGRPPNDTARYDCAILARNNFPP
ncbi:hypothetical protein IWW50_006414, partial [Coemansia erecta]